MLVVNNIKLLGEQSADSIVVGKAITTLPEGYESKIFSIEYLRDLLATYFPKQINALYVQEQIRASRQEEHTKEALLALSIESVKPQKHKSKKGWTKMKQKLMQDGGKRNIVHARAAREKLTLRNIFGSNQI